MYPKSYLYTFIEWEPMLPYLLFSNSRDLDLLIVLWKTQTNSIVPLLFPQKKIQSNWILRQWLDWFIRWLNKHNWLCLFCLGLVLISRCSKGKNVIALSTTEAKYFNATAVACQAIWLRRVLIDFGMNQMGATPIYYDNQSTIAIVRNPTHHGCARSILTWRLIIFMS